MSDITKYIDECSNYQSIKYLMTTNIKVEQYKNIAVSVSGGSDSDIMIDMFTKCDDNKKVKYVFFDTGLEYQATINHLNFLEEKYGIIIERVKAIKPIPLSCKQYGQPFMSKHVSEMMRRLQKHNFKWEDEPFEVLLKKYCVEIPKENALNNGNSKKGISEYNGYYYKGCCSALEWWCNAKSSKSHNISQNKLLKEFIIANPPNFKIDNKCCNYAKKDTAHQYNKINNIELDVTGVRKAEGGVRALAYKNCFDKNDDTYDKYRPLFYFTDKDKLDYKKFFDVTYSDCYEMWGMKRTGCVGCPYGKELIQELELCKKYEPKLYKAVCNVFKDSYTYTEQYYEFRKECETNKC